MDTQQVMQKAFERKTVIPAFNIPYLPMVKPVALAVADENSVAMIQVARVEWEKFKSQSLEAVAEEYAKYENKHTLLHLDHVPVIDEDYLEVDYLPIIKRAIAAGYKSVMIDASRLEFEENLRITQEVCAFTHSLHIPCEAELGSVMGHEKEVLPYEEIFATKRGFTDLAQAKQFIKETNCDWLSVAVGNIHGAIAENVRHEKKPEARLSIEHIAALSELGVPLVLHGGSGIHKQCITDGIKNGIAKINVGTEIRQTYEKAMEESNDIEFSRNAVYHRTRKLISEFFNIKNTYNLLFK